MTDVTAKNGTESRFQKFPIQYINDDFLKRYTRTQDLSTVHHLCLTSNVISPYKILYLDNLEGLRYLTVLNVSGNAIEHLEGLRTLTRLKCLNLNQNRVARLDGLETLKNLQRLYLNHNLVTDFPPWFQNRLVSLKSLQIGHNKIENLHVLSKLRRLPNLTELVIRGNPVTDPNNEHSASICSPSSSVPVDQQEQVFEQCYRAFVIYHLRTLTVLDSKTVEPEERKGADAWFDQSEMARISGQLAAREAEVAELSDCLARLSIEAEGRGARADGLARQRAQQDARLAQMRRELAAKDELLRAKSDELLKACLKHYEIEQELAFYKLDNKFASRLGNPPDIHAGETNGCHADSSSVDFQTMIRSGALSAPNEAPYVGKCRFVRMGESTFNSYNTLPTSGAVPRNRGQVANDHFDGSRAKSMGAINAMGRSLTAQNQFEEGIFEEEDGEDAVASSTDQYSATSGQRLKEEEEEEEELAVEMMRGARATSTPLKVHRNTPPGVLKSRNIVVTMPAYATSPEPEMSENSTWMRDGGGGNESSNRQDSPVSSTNQRSKTRSTVRIQCDSGIETANHCPNDVQESSLDDGQIESLPNSPRLEPTLSQRRDSSTQVSTPSQSLLPRNNEASNVESSQRHWQEHSRQGLVNSSAESINVRASVHENDLKMMKKELARLQAAFVGFSNEKLRMNSETGSEEAGRQKTSDDVDFVSTGSESNRPPIAKSRTSKQPTLAPSTSDYPRHHPQRRRSVHQHHQSSGNHLACSWNGGDQTEDSPLSEWDLSLRRRNSAKSPSRRLKNCLRGAASAVDIRRNQSKTSLGCLKYRGKSTEALPENTPLDVQLLYKLQVELYDLHDRLQYAENSNASRLQEAIQHMEVLEDELRRGRGMRESPEQRKLQNQLTEGLDEMRRCRESILDLQRRISQDNSNLSQGRRSQSGDLEEMRKTIQAQERELSKLTRIVSRLTQGPAPASAADTNSAADVTEVARVVPSRKLMCNVAEHHNLEDYLQLVRATADELREQLQQKRAKIKEMKNATMALEEVVKDRENELNRVTNELLASKKELLAANEKVKSILTDRSSQNDQYEAQKTESQRLEAKISELTNQLGSLKAEVSAMERQKERRSEELAELTRRVQEKRAQLEKRTAIGFNGFITDGSSPGGVPDDGIRRSESIHSMSPRSELDLMQPKISEARNRMESLTREIGARTAELEHLRRQKSQETRLADAQLDSTRRELHLKLEELNSARDELHSIRRERDRLVSEIQSARQNSSLHLTSDDIPPISRDVSEMTQQLQSLKADIRRHKDEITELDDRKRAKKEEIRQLEKSLTETNEALTLAQTRRQTAETQLALSRQKAEMLKRELESFEASVEVKQKLISDLCSSSESRIITMEKEIQRMLEFSQQLGSEKNTVKSELDKLRRQVQQKSSELQSLEEQISSARQKLDKPETLARVSRASEKLRVLTEKIAFQKSESEKLAREISRRQSMLETAPKGTDELESRIRELEGLLRQREHEIEVLVSEKTRMMEEQDQMVTELSTTRERLEQSQRFSKKLKRRTAKELADLERVAEEQCNRASAFSQELTLLRSNYAYLQARIAANEDVSDRERRLQEALFAIKAELAASNSNPEGMEAAMKNFEALELLVRRSVHSPFNDIPIEHLKSFSSVPHLSMPNGGSAESLGEDHQTPPPNGSVVVVSKSARPPSSSGVGSSITAQSTSDERLLYLQEQAKRQIEASQAQLEQQRSNTPTQ